MIDTVIKKEDCILTKTEYTTINNDNITTYSFIIDGIDKYINFEKIKQDDIELRNNELLSKYTNLDNIIEIKLELKEDNKIDYLNKCAYLINNFMNGNQNTVYLIYNESIYNGEINTFYNNYYESFNNFQFSMTKIGEKTLIYLIKNYEIKMNFPECGYIQFENGSRFQFKK